MKFGTEISDLQLVVQNEEEYDFGILFFSHVPATQLNGVKETLHLKLQNRKQMHLLHLHLKVQHKKQLELELVLHKHNWIDLIPLALTLHLTRGNNNKEH